MLKSSEAHAIIRPTTLAIATHVLGFAAIFHPAALLAQPQPVCPPRLYTNSTLRQWRARDARVAQAAALWDRALEATACDVDASLFSPDTFAPSRAVEFSIGAIEPIPSPTAASATSPPPTTTTSICASSTLTNFTTPANVNVTTPAPPHAGHSSLLSSLLAAALALLSLIHI